MVLVFRSWFLLFCLGCTLDHQPCEAQVLRLPDRHPDAQSGSEIADELVGLNLSTREQVLLREFEEGNVPSWLRLLTPIEVTADVQGIRTRMVLWVTSDYLAVGSDEDYFRGPLSPAIAQQIADLSNSVLPTPRMVNLIWDRAEVKLTPQPIPPGPEMTEIPVFRRHHDLIQQQLIEKKVAAGVLVVGHKKDIARRTFRHMTTHIQHQSIERSGLHGFLLGQNIVEKT